MIFKTCIKSLLITTVAKLGIVYTVYSFQINLIFPKFLNFRSFDKNTAFKSMNLFKSFPSTSFDEMQNHFLQKSFSTTKRAIPKELVLSGRVGWMILLLPFSSSHTSVTSGLNKDFNNFVSFYR